MLGRRRLLELVLLELVLVLLLLLLLLVAGHRLGRASGRRGRGLARRLTLHPFCDMRELKWIDLGRTILLVHATWNVLGAGRRAGPMKLPVHAFDLFERCVKPQLNYDLSSSLGFCLSCRARNRRTERKAEGTRPYGVLGLPCV